MSFLLITLITGGALSLVLALVGMGLLVRIAMRSTVPVRRIEDLMSIPAQAAVNSSPGIVILSAPRQADDSLAA